MPQHRVKSGYFLLEAINAFAAAYFFNYLFFDLRRRFGFDNAENLALTVLHGLVYAVGTWFSGRWAQRHGYLAALRLGFGGMSVALALGGLVPRVCDGAPAQIVALLIVVLLWTVSMCFTWPTLEALVSEREPPAGLQRMLGIYNVVWAASTAVAYFTGGAIVQGLGWDALFWLPAALHAIQFGLTQWLQRLSARASGEAVSATLSAPLELNPRPIAKARTFLRLAWVANPFAYVAINALLPVIPRLAERFALTPMYAGFFCSVWFFARLVAFAGLWLWPGWHYRFLWLFGAFLALTVSFVTLLLAPALALVVGAQVAFGLAVGLIYYSSLFYSMDVGERKGEHGGIHEAVIGVGICGGPALSLAGLKLFPPAAHASTWAVAAVLLAGAVALLILRQRGWKEA
jgi:predicted MFS family arabinose efflux permease